MTRLPNSAIAVVAVCFALTACLPQISHAQLGGTAGGFTRMGFGARGQGMGNALSAVSTGTISSHYNPALTPFQTGHSIYGNYSLLSLDRRLNQISYTQAVYLRKKGAKKFEEAPDVYSISGVSAGWINAGDGNIQGYDNEGCKTRVLGVFENQFFLNFGTRFSQRLSAGLNVKFYYTTIGTDIGSVEKQVSSSGFGVDFGLLYFITDRVSIALVIQELLTKYKWDTGAIYGPERGNTMEDPFARILRAAVAYRLPEDLGIVDAEIEMFGKETYLARIGAEIPLVEQLAVRAGVERLDLNGKGIDPRPSFGVTFTQPVAQFQPSASYAFILEPVAPSPTHVFSIALNF